MLNPTTTSPIKAILVRRFIAGSLPQAANDCSKATVSVGPVPGVGRYGELTITANCGLLTPGLKSAISNRSRSNNRN
jgi:hypothetical protein